MEHTCSLCGSDKEVESNEDVYVCSFCRVEKTEVIFRLKFAKWAVEHGKISDFPGKIDELYSHSVGSEQAG